MKLKWLVKNNNSGEVIDKTYWGEGDEILYTCSKNRLSSSFSKFHNWKRTTINDFPIVLKRKKSNNLESGINLSQKKTFFDKFFL